MMKISGMRAVALAATLLFAGPTAAEAQTPDPATVPVQTLYDTLLDAMKHAKDLGIEGRYEKLKPVVEQVFDIPDMVRVAVGPDKWAAATPAEQTALQTAFLRYTAASYASNFDGYSGEKFLVDPTTAPRGADKIVLSKLVTRKETVPFGYRLHQAGSDWRILDIYLNGSISQLANQRSEYASTLSAGGVPALIRKIDALTDKLLAG
jgi:phospholipid transport system substrate-binding protein